MIKTIIGNFLKVAQNSGKFPVDAETLENFQNNTALTAALGAALGKNYVILSGCTESGNNRSEGYVYVKLSASDPGEVLYFPGGNSHEPNCYVRADDIDITAKGEPYEKAYTSRILSNGLPARGEKKLAWGDFVTGSEIFAQKTHSHKISDVTNLQQTLDSKLPTATYNTKITELQNSINSKLSTTTYNKEITTLQQNYDTKIQGLEKAVSAPAVTFVKGMIIMWSGVPSTIPRGWKLCDGKNGTPDLSNRFIVGSVEVENGIDLYVGYTGGVESNQAKINLTYKDIPAHRHIFVGDGNINNAKILTRAGTRQGEWSGDGKGVGFEWLSHGTVFKDSDSAYDRNEYNLSDTCVVKSQSMDNRPPFYCLAFIMYVGV